MYIYPTQSSKESLVLETPTPTKCDPESEVNSNALIPHLVNLVRRSFISLARGWGAMRGVYLLLPGSRCPGRGIHRLLWLLVLLLLVRLLLVLLLVLVRRHIWASCPNIRRVLLLLDVGVIRLLLGSWHLLSLRILLRVSRIRLELLWLSSIGLLLLLCAEERVNLCGVHARRDTGGGTGSSGVGLLGVVGLVGSMSEAEVVADVGKRRNE